MSVDLPPEKIWCVQPLKKRFAFGSEMWYN